VARIFVIAWKDALVRFSSKTELLFFLILPVMFTFLLSGVGGEAMQKIPILVVDQDASSLSTALIQVLASNEDLDVKVTSQVEAISQFKNRQTPAWVVIPSGLEAQLTADLRQHWISIRQPATPARMPPNERFYLRLER